MLESYLADASLNPFGLHDDPLSRLQRTATLVDTVPGPCREPLRVLADYFATEARFDVPISVFDRHVPGPCLVLSLDCHTAQVLRSRLAKRGLQNEGEGGRIWGLYHREDPRMSELTQACLDFLFRQRTLIPSEDKRLHIVLSGEPTQETANP